MSIVGIDLGTTYSAVTRLGDDGSPVTIPNAEGDLTTPSVVYIEHAGGIVVGRHAKRALKNDPDHVVQNIKRHIGEKHYRMMVQGKSLGPIEISSLILRKLKQDAERLIGPITGAVITVPAYFDEGRRQDTVAAGELAGLRVIDIINEPTAAALAHVYRDVLGANGNSKDPLERLRTDRKVNHLVVYDLGGGTFDVSVLRRQGGDLKVLATAGDIELGGVDWNQRIVDHVAELFLGMHGLDARLERPARERLEVLAEEVKRDLSTRRNAPYEFYHAGHELSGELTREEFEQISQDLLFRTESRLNRVLRESGLNWSRVDRVLAVGGSMRMPHVIDMIKRVTGKAPDLSLSPDEAVAHGAAIHAAIVAMRSDKADVPDKVMVLGHETLMARLGSKVVALLRNLKTTGVNAHSLGVVTVDGRGRSGVSQMIERNTSLPATVTRCFGTMVENQDRVTVQITEGEAPTANGCIPVGTCVITSLPKNLPRASPVEVTFTYDTSGRLHVEAVHATSGTWAQTQIERNAGVDPHKVHVTDAMLKNLVVT